jgi:hypothetical protein
MDVLVFSTRTGSNTVKELVPTKRKRNNGTIVLNNYNSKYAYKPSEEYEKYLLKVGHK